MSTEKIHKIKKIFKYIIPYKKMLMFIIVGFLAGQICMLFLPNLMSDIVDVGIRQSGIEKAFPEAMPQHTYRILSAFMKEAEKETVNRLYIDLDFEKQDEKRESPEKLVALKNKYPNVKNKVLYVLKDDFATSSKNSENLNEIFLTCISRLFKYLNTKGLSQEVVYQNISDFQVKLENLYDKASEFEGISSEEIAKLDKQNLVNFDAHQAAAALNKQIYIEIGLDVFKIQRNYIIKVGLIMLSVTIASLAINTVENYFLAKMSSGILRNLRKDIFYKVASFSQKEFDKITTSSLITRTINDVEQMKETIMSGTLIFIPPVMLIGGIIMALNKCASLSWTIILGAVISSTVIFVVLMLVLPKMELMQKLLDKFNLIIKERLSGIMVTNTFGNVKWEENRFDNINKELSEIASYVNKLVLRVSPFLMVTMNFLSLLIIWLGSEQIVQSKLQVGDLMAFVQYSSMVIGAFLTLVMMLFSIPHALISINRILEVLDLEVSVKDLKECKTYGYGESFKGELCFKNVFFTYGNKENMVLKNINFSAKRGQVVSIIGSTGSGKSTLASLIPRFYDVTAGEILIDGINIKHVSQESLREKITYVPQRSILFTGDVEYNLRWGNLKASKEKINSCMEICRITDFLESKEGLGLKREVSQEGKDFSGGQRQKICIARALLRDTPIYIFDDSFSSMDFLNDFEIRKNMAKITQNSLVILVSQRICTVMNSDKIIVLDKGEILAEGTHEELLKICPIYKEIVTSQASEEIDI